MLLQSVGQVVRVGFDHRVEGAVELPMQIFVMHTIQLLYLYEELKVFGEPIQLNNE